MGDYTKDEIDSPHQLGLKHDAWRPGQLETIEEIIGASKPVTLLQAPTGSGKSLIALGIARTTLGTTHILTHTKSLQEQYIEEGEPWIVKMVGRSNYPCAHNSNDPEERELDESLGELSCGCASPDICPYMMQKKKAMHSPLVSLNYAYWLPETTYVGGFSGARYVVADEGHLLDGVLTDFSSMHIGSITIKALAYLGVRVPSNIDNLTQWVEYGKAARAVANNAISETTGRVMELWRKRSRLVGKLASMEPSGERWIVEEDGAGGVIIKPVWAPSIKQTMLAQAKQLIIMSATILDPQMYSSLVGLVPADYNYITMPWTFPRDSRPVYYRPVADITKETQQAAAPALAGAIDHILERRKADKGIIHSRSFLLGQMVYQFIQNKDRIMFHHRGMDRGELIRRFKDDRSGMWLMSPSVSHGEDFANEVARCQVILKMPLPDRGSRIVRIRSRQRPAWYYYAAAQELVQMLGRVTRDKEDYGESWILDGKFDIFLGRYRYLIPKEILDAMV